MKKNIYLLIFFTLIFTQIYSYDRVAPLNSPVVATAYYTKIESEGEKRLEIVVKRGISEVKILCWEEDDRVFADFYILDDLRVHNRIFIPYSLENLFYTAFENIVETTKYTVNWNYILPQVSFTDLTNIKNIVYQINDNLDSIVFSKKYGFEDYTNISFLENKNKNENENENENIETPILVNSFTFVKWIADGLYFAKYKRFIDLDNLLEKRFDYRGNQWSNRVEDLEDPYLGLDWSRNIAYEFTRLEKRDVCLGDCDVKEEIAFEFYKKDVGFSVKDLRQVLYYLAVNKPNYFYIGALSQLSGKENNYRTYQHVLVFFPYIDSDGGFEIKIFENGHESTIQEIEHRYQKNDSFMHLVEIRAEKQFFLKDFKNLPTVDR